MKGKGLKKQSNQPLELLPLLMLRAKERDPVLRLLPQTDYPELPSPPIFSHIPSCLLMLGLKVCEFQVLGIKVWVTTAWLCFSFRLDQFHVAQRDPSASVSWILGLKVCATTDWPLWLSSVASSALWSSSKLYLLDHRQNITTNERYPEAVMKHPGG